MDMIKLFEEYRYINFSDPNIPLIRRKKYSTKKDENEPFFNKQKKQYKIRLEREAEREAERDAIRRRGIELLRQQQIERAKKIEEENKKRAIEEFPIIYKYINILKNYQEKIIKSKYDRLNNRYLFGILLDDKTKLISCFDKPENGIFCYLSINGKMMTNERDKKKNLELDPFEEENWSSKLSPSEILGLLIREYVVENEIMF